MWELMKLLAKSPIKMIKFIIHLVKLIFCLKNIKDLKMTQDKIDTIKGIVRAVVLLLAVFGINLGTGAEELIVTFILSGWSIFELVMGLISGKDDKQPENN